MKTTNLKAFNLIETIMTAIFASVVILMVYAFLSMGA